MLKVLTGYLEEELRPRIWGVLFHPNVGISLSVAVAAYFWAPDDLLGRARIHLLADSMLTYSAIALGFALTGLTLALALPDQKFIDVMISAVDEKTKKCTYSDLIFVYSWTAIMHWCLVVAACALSVVSYERMSWYQYLTASWMRVGASLFLSLSTYAIMQFLVTIITLSTVGGVYIIHLNERKKS